MITDMTDSRHPAVTLDTLIGHREATAPEADIRAASPRGATGMKHA